MLGRDDVFPNVVKSMLSLGFPILFHKTSTACRKMYFKYMLLRSDIRYLLWF